MRDKGDWGGWLNFFLEGVQVVVAESTTKTRVVLALQAEDQKRVSTLGSCSGNALTVLEYLYRSPYVNVRKVKEVTGLLYAAASKLTELLLGADILSPLNQRQRDRVFFHRRYTTLFEM